MSTQSPSGALYCVASGRVQGVGFRAFVAARARELGLRGWVRNASDGRSVEVWAEGSRAWLEALRELVATGPSGARVDALRCEWHEPTGRFDEFGILR